MTYEESMERRRYRRVNVRIPVKYREITSDEIVVLGKLMKPSECVDISRGGMQMITEDDWTKEKDRLIEAEFIMSGRTIRLIAHIAWARFDSEINKFRAGAEFIAIKSGDLEVIGQIA